MEFSQKNNETAYLIIVHLSFSFSDVATLKRFQRQVHLACWHDGSTVNNHAHLLIMIMTLYDPAIFYSNDEYRLKTGEISHI